MIDFFFHAAENMKGSISEIYPILNHSKSKSNTISQCRSKMTMMRNKELLYKENISVNSFKRLVNLSNQRAESLTIGTSRNMIYIFLI